MGVFSNPAIEVVTFRGMVRAGCVFVVGIHPSRA